MDQNYMLNPNGHESALGGKHQHSDVMANHRMEQQNQEYSPLQMGYNPGSMDVSVLCYFDDALPTFSR